jgi:DNA-binding NarL/FixJ family response regulator
MIHPAEVLVVRTTRPEPLPATGKRESTNSTGAVRPIGARSRLPIKRRPGLGRATVRLILVDDYPLVHGGLVMLAEREGFKVVAATRTIAAARRALQREEVDVGVAEIRLPDGLGLELLSSIGGTGRSPPWILLSTVEDPWLIAAALKRGAAGYILKSAQLDDLAEAIRRVAAGGTAFEARHLALSDALTLTDREKTVIRGVLASRSNDEIAVSMGLARKTVEAYLTRIFARFGILSRTELALRAQRESWLDTASG